MMDENDIKVPINKYHKLLEDLKAENINLEDEFVVSLHIEKELQVAKTKAIASQANLGQNKSKRKI